MIVDMQKSSKINGRSKMSYHIQFESNMTLSGANADNRIPTNPINQKNYCPYLLKAQR